MEIMVYTFIPLLPTKEAYENREFRDQSSIADILRIMEEKEKSRGKKYSGIIYFKEGIVSTHNDGTRNKPIEPTRAEIAAWAKLEMDRGVAGVDRCVYDLMTIGAYGKRLSYKAQNFLAYSDDFRYKAVDTFFYPPIKREYQNFRHVYDLQLQLRDIKDHTTIRKLWINDIGYFEPS